MYPNEPIITVVAPLIDAQLIETAILTQVNHQSLIATKNTLALNLLNVRSLRGCSKDQDKERQNHPYYSVCPLFHV